MSEIFSGPVSRLTPIYRTTKQQVKRCKLTLLRLRAYFKLLLIYVTVHVTENWATKKIR